MRNTAAAANAFGFESAFRDHPPNGFLAEIETFRQYREILAIESFYRNMFGL